MKIFTVCRPYFQHNILTYLVFAASLFVVQSVKHNINITRGSNDEFSGFGMISNCDRFGKARCVDSLCTICKCDGNYRTFRLESIGEHDYTGKCKADGEFVTSIDKINSFGVHQEENNVCMFADSKTNAVIANTMACNDAAHNWIWTKYNQLLHFATLKCLQRSTDTSLLHGVTYPNVFLDVCNASNLKQLWECGNENLFANKYQLQSKMYLNYGNTGTVQVILFTGNGTYSRWERCHSKQTLCSDVSSYIGCYKYSDGDSMFLISTSDINRCKRFQEGCSKAKHIQAPIESTHDQCFLQGDMTRFLNYSSWDLFPLNVENIFALDGKQVTLKVDLTKISREFQGQVLKLYVHCTNSNHQTIGETHCILVKITGKFNAFYLDAITESLPSTTFPSLMASSLATILPSSRNEKRTARSNSTTVVAVVVPLVIVLLIVGSILAYLYFRRRRSHEKDNQGKTINGETRAPLSAESQNIIYNSSAVNGKTECQLYEPGDEQGYYYSNPDYGRSPHKPNEQTYDYATTGDLRSAGESRNIIYGVDEPGGEKDCELYEPGDEQETKSRDKAEGVTYDYAAPDDLRNTSQPPSSGYEDCLLRSN